MNIAPVDFSGFCINPLEFVQHVASATGILYVTPPKYVVKVDAYACFCDAG